jgi:aarF domain-containing kinase
MRNFKFLRDRTDVVGILDEFAYRFYEELDYKLECQNGLIIREHMKNIPDIIIPRNYPDLTTRKVFVTEWIDGEKLSQSTAGDVQKLVNLGVVAYLTQLLDTGLFHAGNDFVATRIHNGPFHYFPVHRSTSG